MTLKWELIIMSAEIVAFLWPWAIWPAIYDIWNKKRWERMDTDEAKWVQPDGPVER